jgi:hypothetical protein
VSKWHSRCIHLTVFNFKWPKSHRGDLNVSISSDMWVADANFTALDGTWRNVTDKHGRRWSMVNDMRNEWNRQVPPVGLWIELKSWEPMRCRVVIFSFKVKQTKWNFCWMWINVVIRGKWIKFKIKNKKILTVPSIRVTPGGWSQVCRAAGSFADAAESNYGDNWRNLSNRSKVRIDIVLMTWRGRVMCGHVTRRAESGRRMIHQAA